MAAKFFSAILIYSENVERLGSFYRDILGIPLEEEKHGPEALHYSCELGELHFAIHPAVAGKSAGVGAVVLAFEVFNLEAHMQQMREHNVNVISQTEDFGFMKKAVIADPDGNQVEFTEMSENWIDHLRTRRDEGHNMVAALG